MNVEKIKRMPIFFPIIALIAVLYNVFYIFPLYLVGNWWCDDCGERFGMEDKQVHMQYGDICLECNKQH